MKTYCWLCVVVTSLSLSQVQGATVGKVQGANIRKVQDNEFIQSTTDIDSGRFFAVNNVSLVITYTGAVVAVVMMASFLWLAASFGNSRSYGRTFRNKRNAEHRKVGLEDMAALLGATLDLYEGEEEGEEEGNRKQRMNDISCQEYAEFCLIGDKVRQNNLEIGEALPLVFSALGRSGNHDFRSSLKTFLGGLQGRNCQQKPEHC